MTPQELLLWVFCLVDDELQALMRTRPRLRSRGPATTKLSDAEVITIELVGEFWGLDRDRALYRHFRAYHAAEFPALASVARTTFARQAANLWAVKQLLQQRLAQRLSAGEPVWLVDSMPVEACQFARATFCRRFGGEADYGYDHLHKQTFYGFRLHLRVSRAGVIQAMQLAPARASDKAVLEDLEPPPGTTGIGDRGSWDPALRERRAEGGVRLLAPYQHKSKDPDQARSRRLSSVRYRVETVNGQLADRYNVKRTWAKDLWHLCHRLIRKALSHTVMVWVAVKNGLPPLAFDGLQPAA
jgi:Transposase DDE domain